MGIITKEFGAAVNDYELSAAEYIADVIGFNVTLLAAVRLPYRKTPDMFFDGRNWEVKTPIANGLRTIENILRSGKHQSENMVLDLRYTKRRYSVASREAQKFFIRDCRIRKLYIIGRNYAYIFLQK